MSTLRVLMLSKDFGAPGGVVQVVRAMMAHFSRAVTAEHLAIGRPTGNNGVPRALLAPLIDNARLVKRARSGRFDRIQINASLNTGSLLRDGLFLVLLRVVGFDSVVVFFHGWQESTARQIADSSLLRWMFLKTFGRARLILVLATSFQDALTAMGVPSERTVLSSTMFDGGQFAGMKRQRTDDRIRLVFMSRFVREKGVLEVLDAYAALWHDYPDTELWLVGDGPELDRIISTIERHGLQGRVTLPGYLRGDEKAQMLLDSDLFVFPTSYGEGCPISLLESMAAGLPVITHKVGGIPDVFEEPANGILLPNVSAHELEEAIRQMLNDPRRMIATGFHNRKQAWESFEAKAVTRRLEGLFLEDGRFQVT